MSGFWLALLAQPLTMETSSVQIIETGDGSHTLLNVTLDETYHSRHGALRESEYVFIQQGWHTWLSQHPEATTLRLLEVGMGTGLNVLLTIREALARPSVTVHYTTLEPFPLSEDTLGALNYLSLLKDDLHPYFTALHQAPWNTPHALLPHFTLNKQSVTLQDYSPPPEGFDLIYFDAFAPNKQAELWEMPTLQKVVGMMQPSAIFVTYSAKGQLKRDLKTLGLTVETLSGPPGKAEMVRATKQA